MTFHQQEPVVPGVIHQPATGCHQPLPETRALEEAELLADDIRAFFRELR